MKSTFHGGITYQGFSTGSGKSTGVPCAAWPVPPDHRIGVAASAPEPCSVPWPDNFSEDEMKWQYQSVTSGMQLEAGTPAEDVDLMTATSGDDLLPDEGAARQTWAARTGDETEEDEAEEDKPRAKRSLPGLPEFVTTLIVRNIPYVCTQTDLQEEWPIRHFAYDYLHLPLDTRNRPLGYAFLNFLEPLHASEFYSQWHGQFLMKHHFSKSLSVTVAHRQGRHANLLGVKGNNLKAGVPVVFQGGIRLTKEEVLQAIETAKRSMAKPSGGEGRFQ